MTEHEELILAFQHAFGYKYRSCNIRADMSVQPIYILGSHNIHSTTPNFSCTVQLMLKILPGEDFPRTDLNFGYEFPLVQLKAPTLCDFPHQYILQSFGSSLVTHTLIGLLRLEAP